MKPKESVRITKVEDIVSRMSGVDVKDLRKSNRHIEVVEARMVIWYICHKFMGLSYMEIAKFYNKNHTTVMHAIKKIDKNPDQVYEFYVRIREIYPEVFKEVKGLKTIENWHI